MTQTRVDAVEILLEINTALRTQRYWMLAWFRYRRAPFLPVDSSCCWRCSLLLMLEQTSWQMAMLAARRCRCWRCSLLLLALLAAPRSSVAAVGAARRSLLLDLATVDQRAAPLAAVDLLLAPPLMLLLLMADLLLLLAHFFLGSPLEKRPN